MSHNFPPDGPGVCANPGCDVVRERSIGRFRSWRYSVDGIRLPEPGPCLGRKVET